MTNVSNVSDELSFAYHLKAGCLTGNAKNDAYFISEAAYYHALRVAQAILESGQQSVALSWETKDKEILFHLRFGFARRTKLVWHALNNLLKVVAPEREEPLDGDEVDEINRDLNVIYMNVRGAMDNLAWALFFELSAIRRKVPKPTKIDLFNSEMHKFPGLDPVAKITMNFLDWSKDFKKRRDPAAHRIPLAVPPSFLDDAALKQYRSAEANYNEAVKAAFADGPNHVERLRLLEAMDPLYAELRKIGVFKPVFYHHPDELSQPIYPTVPEDVAQLVRIGRECMKLISEKLAQ